MSEKNSPVPWLILLAIYLALGFAFSVIQPLARAPDESAHMQYTRFLANERRLPVWKADGGGEAGYESQHPPLYYAAAAAVYKAVSWLPENWRWQCERWFMLLIGVALFWVARSYFLEFFRDRTPAAVAATAAFMLTPLTVMYTSYANVDGMAVAWSCVILWLSTRVARGEATAKDRIALGLAFGAGLLTKLTVLAALPVIALAFALDPTIEPARKWEQRRLRFLAVLLCAILVSGWWYLRSSALYGTPLTHTIGRFGSGYAMAHYYGGAPWLLYYSLRETYLSLWVQRGWLPTGFPEIGLYALLSLLLAIALIGLLRRRNMARGSGDPAPLLAAMFFLTLIIGHQLQVWLVDYEFNAGGRYLLNGLMGLLALILAGLDALPYRKMLPMLLLGVLLAMNLVSGWRVFTILNPSSYPGWTVLHFPSDYDPTYKPGAEQMESNSPDRAGDR